MLNVNIFYKFTVLKSKFSGFFFSGYSSGTKWYGNLKRTEFSCLLIYPKYWSQKKITTTKRVIPDFFEKVYEINRVILEDIERTYKEIEQKEGVDKGHVEMAKDKSTKFVAHLIREIDLLIDEYLFDFKEDREVEKEWEGIKDKLFKIPLTKQRLSELRKIWRRYTHQHKGWKRLIKELDGFVRPKSHQERFAPEPFNKELLRLVVIDFIS